MRRNAFLTMPFGPPNCARFGESALILHTAGASMREQRRLWAVARKARSWPNVCEAVAGAGNVTIVFDRSKIAYGAVEAAVLDAWHEASHVETSVSEVMIPVHYGGEHGPDLDSVARSCGCSSAALVELHSCARYVVAFVGFVPGFAYLDGLDPRLHLPRLARPRTRVPSGSVAIAGAYSAVYPLDSPGGWHLIGKTELRMFDPGRDPFALLSPGDVVRFVPQ